MDEVLGLRAEDLVLVPRVTRKRVRFCKKPSDAAGVKEGGSPDRSRGVGRGEVEVVVGVRGGKGNPPHREVCVSRIGGWGWPRGQGSTLRPCRAEPGCPQNGILENQCPPTQDVYLDACSIHRQTGDR